VNEKTTRRKNLRVFTISLSFMAFAFGLFGPFYYIFINQIGGTIESFGIATGLVVLSSSLVSLVAGKYSDKYGRKPFLIAGGYASAVIVFLYTMISSLWQLYLLQILNGLVVSMFHISETSFLADVTKKKNRGADIGTYNAVVGILEALAIFVGGFIAGKFGFDIVFYIVSVIFVMTTTLLLKVRE